VAYREWIKKQHGGVDLLGLQLKKGRPPSLSAIYVPQTTTPPPDSRRTGIRGQELPTDVDTPRPRYNSALNRLTNESLYVSGAPGTGKSTLCRLNRKPVLD
jgi:hypothetical protein